MIGHIYCKNQKLLKSESTVVILVPDSSDTEDDLQMFASEVAAKLKTDGKYKKIFYNKWLSSDEEDLRRNLLFFKQSLENCKLAILVSDTVGKESYQRILEEKNFSDKVTDFYALGVFSLIGKTPSGFCTIKPRRKILAVYLNSNQNLHEHLISAADYSCDLNRTSEKDKLVSLINR